MSLGETFTIPEHTRRQFQDGFEAALQQREPKFAAVTNVDPLWTARHYVKRMRDTIDWRVNNTRFGATGGEEFEAGFRSGFWQLLEAKPVKFDRADQKLLDTIPLPTGPVIEDMMMGLNRIRDDLFIEAAVEAAKGGKAPHVTDIPFPNGNKVAVNYTKPQMAAGANSGLTVWKVLEARRRLKAAHVDFDQEEMVLAISTEEESQLMLSAEGATNDAWARVTLNWFEERLGGNKEAKLMGFRVIESERLPVSDADIRTCVAFAKRAFCAAPLNGVKTHLDVLPAERHAIQVAAYAQWGCFRVFDDMVQHIYCDRTP